MVSIAENIIAYLEPLHKLAYCEDFGTVKYGASVRHITFNRTYKADGGDNLIDEMISIRIKLKDPDQVKLSSSTIAGLLIGSQVDDGVIRVIECLLLNPSVKLKEAQEFYYSTSSFRFVGEFL